MTRGARVVKVRWAVVSVVLAALLAVVPGGMAAIAAPPEVDDTTPSVDPEPPEESADPDPSPSSSPGNTTTPSPKPSTPGGGSPQPRPPRSPEPAESSTPTPTPTPSPTPSETGTPTPWPTGGFVPVVGDEELGPVEPIRDIADPSAGAVIALWGAVGALGVLLLGTLVHRRWFAEVARRRRR